MATKQVKKQVKLWLTPETVRALHAEAERRGLKYSELAEELITHGLAQHTASRLEDLAVPVFTEAVQQVMTVQLRGLERRLGRRLVDMERSAGMAARIGYTHLYRDHPAEAEADWQQASEEMELALHEQSPLAPVQDQARAVGE